MIEFHNVSKRYPDGQDALVNVNFTLEKGEMAFITGHSGAGKSTLLKLVSIIERPSKGQIVFNRINLNRLRTRQIARHRRQIGSIYQNNLLLADRNLFDNVALPLEIAGYKPAEIRKRVHAALEKVKLRRHEKKLPASLSSGEQQRAGIARAIVSKPDLILADEPTGNLDPDLSREIMELFEEFNQVGVTVMVATHDIDIIKSMPHRVLVLNQGSLIEEWEPVDKQSEPAEQVY